MWASCFPGSEVRMKMPISQAMWRYQMEYYLEQCHLGCYTIDDRVITVIYIPPASIMKVDTQITFI